jgi:predicted ABC-type ATPase
MNIYEKFYKKYKSIDLNLIGDIFKNKVSQSLHFTISYGPPGSGKSSGISNIKKIYELLDKHTIEINVDEVLKKIEDYESIKLAREKNPNDEKIKKKYYELREKADSVTQFIVETSISDNYNVIMETTGNNIDYAVNEIKQFRKHGYHISVIYPYVESKILLNRVMNRKTQINPSETVIMSMALNAQKNIKYLAELCDDLFIYDNNKIKTENNFNDITEDLLLVKTNNKYTCQINNIKKIDDKSELYNFINTKC